MPEESISDSLPQSNIDQNKITNQITSQTPLENPPEKSSNARKQKLLLVFGLVIILLTVLAGGVFAYLNLQSDQKSPELNSEFTVGPTTSQTVKISTEPTKALAVNDSLDPPPLYPEFEWVMIDSTSPGSIKNGNFDNTKLYHDYDQVDFDISGKEWEAKITVNEDENEIIQNFENYYWDYFRENNWYISNEYKGEDLSAIAASGPSGNLVGNFKIVDDKSRLVVMNSNNGVFASQNNGCPCSYSFNVFISDILDLKELLDATK